MYQGWANLTMLKNSELADNLTSRIKLEGNAPFRKRNYLAILDQLDFLFILIL